MYDHYVPPTVGAIISRGEFLTSYTPYQPEVSQGTLQSIYEFQTLVSELFGMDLANASMYDAATGLAEAAIMAADLTHRKEVLVPETIHPAYRKALETYLRHLDISLVKIPERDGVGDAEAVERLLSDQTAAVLIQHPNFYGNLENMARISEAAHARGALVIASVDPISLAILAPPGDYGVDIAVGEGQALGCPMGYGGPLLGLFACKKEFVRRLPGRIVGATKDIEGRHAYVMTLRTREQDIRRERATSNICTNVALYALSASVYMATMGKTGLQQVANLSAQKAHYMAGQIEQVPGFGLAYPKASFFKEFVAACPVSGELVNARLWDHGIIGGYPLENNRLLIAVTEQRTKEEIDRFVGVLRSI